MVDVDWPSRGKVSGEAVAATDMPNPDGPLNSGWVLLSIEHPDASMASASTAPERRTIVYAFQDIDMTYGRKSPKLTPRLPVAVTSFPA